MRRRWILIFGLVLALAPAVRAADEPQTDYRRFLEKIAAEKRAMGQAAELFRPPAPEPEMSPIEAMVQEARAARRYRRALSRLQPAPARPPKEQEEADVDKPGLARRLVEKERRRAAELHAERVRRLIRSARALRAEGRYDAAATKLRIARKEDPRNAEAAELLARVLEERRAAATCRLAEVRERERAASLDALEAARVPYAATVTYPPDWAERSRQRRRAAAQKAVAREDAQDRAVRAKLRKKASIDVIETPVSDVASYLRHLSGLNLVVEKEAADKTVTLKLRAVTLESMLEWVARQAGTSWAVRDGCIHVGPPEKVVPRPVTRVYDVSDILRVQQALTRKFALRDPLAPADDDDDRAGLFGGVEERGEKSLEELAGELTDFLREATGRRKWEDAAAGRRMSIHLGKLVVNAEPSVQERVLELVEQVRP